MARNITPDYETDRRFATTLARGLSVLRAFRIGDEGLSNAEIAARTGLPKSTISRLTFTLACQGYLIQARADGRYHPGPTLLAMGHVAASSLAFLDAAQDMMQALANRTGTLVLFAVRDRDKLALVRSWRPENIASIWLEVGHRLPFGASSSGLAMLGATTEDEFDDLMSDHPDAAPDGRSLADLRREGQRQLLSCGYAVIPPDLRHSQQVSAVSVPFRSARLAGPAAFSCGALQDSLPAQLIHQQLGPELRQIVGRLQRMIGQPEAVIRAGS